MYRSVQIIEREIISMPNGRVTFRQSRYLNVKMHDNDELLHKMNALIIMTDDDSHLLRNP